MSVESQPPAGTRQRDIFLAALEMADPAARAEFLRTVCGDDLALRQRVEELLREEESVGAFLETPAASPTPPASGPGGTERIGAVTEKPGDRIGRYKLLQQIGEGGCGVVYMAEQEEPVRRRVALKVIKLGMDTKSVIARFEAERQALAMMDHPNIAKVLDAGATETGRPYFVMELVRGIKITEYCDQNNLPTDARLELFMQVCQAIQHAHQKGIIHRDIKPSNILVTLHDSVPVPKVIDFGIAKATEQRLTDKTLFTEFTAFIGTPAYMSPEQAEMSGLDIDTRSDIYALGVLLYELLTGKTPFDAEELFRIGLDECRRTIREKEPVRPSTRVATMLAVDLTATATQRRTEAPKLIHSLRGDLDWIVMKCLEKDRTRRYDTAHDVAMDAQRYLDDEPVLARPPSTVYRLQKILHRHRGPVAAAAAIVFLLLAGTIISTLLAVRATKAEHIAQASQKLEATLRQRAEREEAAARQNEYVADINLAHKAVSPDVGNLGRAFQLLQKHHPQPGAPDLRGFEWRYLWQLCQGDEHTSLPHIEGTVHSLAVSPDGELVALGFRDKVIIWNTRSKSAVNTLARGAMSLAFLPDGKRLITATTPPGMPTVRVWRTTDWSEERSMRDTGGPLALSKDGSRLATSTRGGVRIWDTATWTNEPRFIPGVFGAMAFSPDGNRLVAEGRGGLTIWRLNDSGETIVLNDSTNLFGGRGPFIRDEGGALAFSPDGKFVVAARNTLSDRGVFVVGIWDAETGEDKGVMPDDPEHIEHTAGISSLAFSSDGRLATASLDHSIRLWDFNTRQRTATLQGHLSEARLVTFALDGRTLASAGADGVKIWPANPQQKEDALPGTWQPLAFTRDSRTLAAVNRDGTVAFLNMATREVEQQFEFEAPRSDPFRRFPRNSFTVMSSVSIGDDFSTLAQALEDGTVRLWNTQTREFTALKITERGKADLVVLSPDGGTLITSGRGRNLRLWDLRKGTDTELPTEANLVLFSRDSRTLVATLRRPGMGGDRSHFGGWTNRIERAASIEIWNVPNHSLRTNIIFEAGLGVEAAALSPDGALLAVSCSDDSIQLFEVATAKLIGTCTGHKQSIFSLAFSPDGKTLASASDDSTMKLWNVATQQELLTERRLGGALRGLTFSPDGRWLVGGGSFSLQTGGLRSYRAALFSETDVK